LTFDTMQTFKPDFQIVKEKPACGQYGEEEFRIRLPAAMIEPSSVPVLPAGSGYADFETRKFVRETRRE
jgi:hypothetical protein